MLTIFLIGLLISMCIVSLRMLLGPTLWDRLLTVNVISSKVILVILTLAVLLDEMFYLDIALTYSLIAFCSTVFIARFIERRKQL